MRVVEPHADLAGHVGRHHVRHRALVLAQGVQRLAQGHPLHALHRDEVGAVSLAELVDLDDVRVQEQRRDLRLPDEHRLEVPGLRQPGQDALEHELALEPLGAGHHRPVDLGHTPLADPAEQAEAAEVGVRFCGALSRGLA